MPGELRNKKVAEPWMVEVNEKIKTILSSDSNSVMNVDGSFLQFRTRTGNGDCRSREYQVHMLVERKQIFSDGSIEDIGYSQMDQIYKLHAKCLQPYAVTIKGSRDLRNFGFCKFQGNTIRCYGFCVLYMNGSTIDSSDSFIWKRPALRKRKNNSRGLTDVEPRDWLEFKTNDPKVIWEILRLERDPDNPSQAYIDRSHHKIGYERVKQETAELGFFFDYRYQPKS